MRATSRLALLWLRFGGSVALSLPFAACASNDVAELETEGRVHVVGQALALSETSAAGASTATNFKGDAPFTYVAAVDAPVNPVTGTVVQATNFAFDNSDAYVVYNTAGPSLGGALEIVDLGAVDQPALIGSTAFSQAEFAGVQVAGNYAYLVGKSGATASLTVVDVSKRAAPRRVASLDLPGFYATSIALVGTTAYVTTGDNGGLMIIDVSDPEAPSRTRFLMLDHATSVVHSDQRIYVLGGTPARIYQLADDTSLNPLSNPLTSDALDAPARMAVWASALYTNAGGRDFQRLALDGSSGLSLLSSLVGTGNGIDVGGGIAVLAQGEAGTSVFDVSSSGATKSLGSFAFPDERGSHNDVRFGKLANANYVFLSDGLGGFRIIRANLALGSDLGESGYDTPRCGDGVRSEGEACDDGNTTPGDGCNSSCAIETGAVCSGEPSSCIFDGAGTRCGNAKQLPLGTFSYPFGFPQNEHWFTVVLQPRETLSFKLNTSGGSTSLLFMYAAGPNGCADDWHYGDVSYRPTNTGRGIVWGGWKLYRDGASASQTNTGNAPLRLLMQHVNYSGVSTNVTVTAAVKQPADTCGNGAIEGNEQCDDAGNVSGDGCSERCVRESGYVCSGSPSLCQQAAPGASCETATLADGVTVGTWFHVTIPPGQELIVPVRTTDLVVSLYQLDPGGCNRVRYQDSEWIQSTQKATRQQFRNTTEVPIEATLSVTPAAAFKPTFTPVGCGDYEVDSGEQCDDGNSVQGDGCSPTCRVESGWTCYTGSYSGCFKN